MAGIIPEGDSESVKGRDREGENKTRNGRL